jgi:hypothetical protein
MICPNLFNPCVPFVTIVLIFLHPSHHLTPCPMHTHKKQGSKAFIMGNLQEFSLTRAISVTNTQLKGKSVIHLKF